MMAEHYVTPIVEVSWDGSGDFDGAYDDVTADVVGDPGVTIETGRDGARSFSPPMVPAADFELYNDDGTYSQHRADSPVYQRVLTGRPVRVAAAYGERRLYRSHTTYQAAGLTYRGIGVWYLARTAIDDIEQQAVLGANRVRLRTLGLIGKLVKQRVTCPLRTLYRTDNAITELLDAISWPADLRRIEIASTTMLYWWCEERSPWDAIVELLATEGPGSAAYIDHESGYFHFEGRNHRLVDTRSTESQATYRDAATSGGLWFTGLRYEPGFDQVVNRATIATKRRSEGTTQKVWEYGDTITLAANASIELIVKPSNPFTDAATPVAATDYTVSAGSATVTLSATSGVTATITITAGASGATIDGVTSDGIQLRAKPLAVIAETLIANSTDAADSIATYGERPYQIPAWPEVDEAEAQAICNSWVSRYQEQRPTITLTLRNADEAHVAEILNRRVGDRVTIVDANTGLEADCWVETKRVTLAGPGGRDLSCEIGCEPAVDQYGAIWDESLWDNAAAVWGI